MNVMCVDKLFLKDHLHWHNDLSHDDQKISCSQTKNKNKSKTVRFFFFTETLCDPIISNKQINKSDPCQEFKKRPQRKQNILPVITSLSLCELSLFPLMKSARPTITSPRMVIKMPIHWLGARRRPKNATESRPVKMITAPRSIWKLEALVMLRAVKQKLF